MAQTLTERSLFEINRLGNSTPVTPGETKRVLDANSLDKSGTEYVTVALGTRGNEGGAFSHNLIARCNIGTGNSCQVIECDVAQGMVLSLPASSIQIDVVNRAPAGDPIEVITTVSYGVKPTSAEGLLTITIGRIDANATSNKIVRPKFSTHFYLLCNPRLYPLLECLQYYLDIVSFDAVDAPNGSSALLPLAGQTRFLAVKNNSPMLCVCTMCFRIGI